MNTLMANNKYEDSLVLKISDPLYVSRGRVMHLVNAAGGLCQYLCGVLKKLLKATSN